MHSSFNLLVGMNLLLLCAQIWRLCCQQSGLPHGSSVTTVTLSVKLISVVPELAFMFCVHHHFLDYSSGQTPHETARVGSDCTIQPTKVNNNVVTEGWNSVGGHAAVIQQLKEMVLLPLQYPEVFKHMGVTPPR